MKNCDKCIKKKSGTYLIKTYLQTNKIKSKEMKNMKARLVQLPGVEEVNLNLSQNETIILYDDRLVDMRMIKEITEIYK